MLLALAGAVISVLAFPPYGPGWLIFFGIGLFLIAIRDVETRKQGLLVGSVYGLVFFGGLMWWLAELELIALILVPLQAAFLAAYAWWLARYNQRPAGVWLTLAVGGWAVMELIRYHYPFGGLEWGAAGYALAEVGTLRDPASLVGTSGLTVMIVLTAALVALRVDGKWTARLTQVLVIYGVVAVLTVLAQPSFTISFPGPFATIVQGSTPCPFEHCPPNERLRTYEQHLELTKSIETNSYRWLTVWSEGSTGSINADPVLNPEVGDAIGEQASRLDSWMLVGGDRTVSDTQWINANVIFDNEGNIVEEYRKQHPVPFGEYIPLRPLFEWIPALDQVPRDMIPGEGPVVVDTGEFRLGSVISFEGAFSRYALETVRAGAEVIVVATNESSYGTTPASDQFIGMTTMRSLELGVPVIHAAVTGKSTFGGASHTTGLGTQELLNGDTPTMLGRSMFSYIGNSVMYLAALLGLLTWWRSRSLVGSNDRMFEEE